MTWVSGNLVSQEEVADLTPTMTKEALMTIHQL